MPCIVVTPGCPFSIHSSLSLSFSLSLSRVLFFCLSPSLVSFAGECACVCRCAGVRECVCVFLSCLHHVHRDPISPTAYLLFQDSLEGTPSLGARLQNLKLARGSAHAAAPILFVFVLIATAPWPAKVSHLASHPHNTLACNHTSLPPPSRPHPPAPRDHLYFG